MEEYSMPKGKNKSISEKAKARWKALSDDEYWDLVDKMKAGLKKHWASLSPAVRAIRLEKLAKARAMRNVDRKKGKP
jgi:hypothetical protein